MKNNGLFSSLFIKTLKEGVNLDDSAHGRMATLAQTWRTRDSKDTATLWASFMKQAVSYLEFVPPAHSSAKGVYPLYDDYGYSKCVAVLYLIEPNANIDDTSVGRYYPAKLLAHLRERKLNFGILTDGATWRLYSTKCSRPYEDYVELPLSAALDGNDESEYGLFERFFHKDSFVPEEAGEDESTKEEKGIGAYKCRLDEDKDQSENVLDELVKSPLLYQIDEVLQYLCNGFIHDTRKTGDEYTEEERTAIFESSVKLLYRCLFLFYAEAHHLLPSDASKAEVYKKHSIQALCNEARKFRWGKRTDTNQYDLWKRLKGLVSAVNDGDPEYGIRGYNGGLFDDSEEQFLGQHQLRNDYLSRALYLLAYVEPYDNDSENEYAIPYQDLEVRHLGELYENILEYTVQLADADRFRRRTKKGVELLLASQTSKQIGDTLIRKGDVYFGESTLERKQTGSYYTPESLVRFLNEKTIIQPLRERFERTHRRRFDEFLDEALNGPEIGGRRGAAQSAAVLVERFAKEDVLEFKACDPAMGSGHFLVDAANQMAGLVVELLEEIPDVDDLHVSTTSHPNAWRRLVTRHCLYGVDLNPLAVNLAKLSLWLNCFAKDHKLTFIDHHLRQGNSLVGLRSIGQLKSIPKRKRDSKSRAAQALLFDFEDLSEAFNAVAMSLATIGEIAEDDTETQKAVLEEAHETTSVQMRPLADLFTGYLMDASVTPEDYSGIFKCLADGVPVNSGFTSNLSATWSRLKAHCNRHQFFHWPLEFPDVFGSEVQCGFSATVGNPPWDMVTAEPAEYFGKYDSSFRSLKRSESLKRMELLCGLHPNISEGWEQHKNYFKETNSILNEPVAYEYGPTGRNNLYQYFLHRSYDILGSKGCIGMVLPGSFNADKGSYPLRKLYFEKCKILTFFCFSNEKFIFKNVHHAFRFIALSALKGEKTDNFKVCFLTDPREAVAPGSLNGVLQHLVVNGLDMSYQTVNIFSPGKLSVLEFRRQRDVSLVEHLYGVSDLLGKSSNEISFRFSIEMMSNNDAWRFDEATESDVPVYVGRCFKQYDHELLQVSSYISKEMLDGIYANSTMSPWRECRLVFRDVTGGTSERTCISSILPPQNACLETARILYPSSQNNLCNEKLQAYTLAILNSFCLDYVMRFMVRLHLSQHIMERAPFARCLAGSKAFNSLIARVARLVATQEPFREFWRACFNDDWQSPSFWYPGPTPIHGYGPAHEQDIRRRLQNEASTLTSEWGHHCGVHDRLSDRRDTGDRAQLRAEIDAHVAHLYELNRDDFAYILDSFPVLKKKEERSFGEFITKRKCLEEYDRLAPILGEKS